MLTFWLYIAISMASSYSRHLTDGQVNRYAHAIHQQAINLGIEELDFVAIISHESEWNERAISPDKLDRGLMQVRYLYYSGKPEWLLNPEENIRAGANVLRSSIDLCRKVLHREPKFQEYYACFSGSCSNLWSMCRPTRLTKKLEDY